MGREDREDTRWREESKFREGFPPILELGCGTHRQPGPSVCMDKWEGAECDVLHDAEDFPWPFPDDTFQVVYMFQFLEHIDNVVDVLHEIWRVCRDGAIVLSSTPNGCCPGYAQDPTHKTPINLGTYLYFCPEQCPWVADFDVHCHYEVVWHYAINQDTREPWGEIAKKDDLRVVLRVIKRGETEAPP